MPGKITGECHGNKQAGSDSVRPDLVSNIAPIYQVRLQGNAMDNKQADSDPVETYNILNTRYFLVIFHCGIKIYVIQSFIIRIFVDFSISIFFFIIICMFCFHRNNRILIKRSFYFDEI